MSDGGATDELFYAGTQTRLLLGDRVRVKRMLRRSRIGTVCYVPGVSPVHPEMEYGGLRFWAVELDDRTVLSWPVVPGSAEVIDSVEFLERGKTEGLRPEEELT